RPDEVGQDGERLLEVGAGVRALELVDVDVVGAEAAQRALDGSGDPAAGATLQVRPLAHRQTDLGGEDHLVAAPLERSPDDLLRVAVAVRGVDEVDPCVERLVDDPDRLVRVVAHLAGEHERAECVGADLDAGPPERAVLHKRAPSVRGGGLGPAPVRPAGAARRRASQSTPQQVDRQYQAAERADVDTGGMTGTTDLGRALHAWRDRTTPADVGLSVDGVRRAPGLRREELSRLAGLSVDYIVRLEQGRATNPSPQVLSALARALRLTTAEREHLFRSEEHTSELQSREKLVCRLLLEKKKT